MFQWVGSSRKNAESPVRPGLIVGHTSSGSDSGVRWLPLPGPLKPAPLPHPQRHIYITCFIQQRNDLNRSKPAPCTALHLNALGSGHSEGAHRVRPHPLCGVCPPESVSIRAIFANKPSKFLAGEFLITQMFVYTNCRNPRTGQGFLFRC